MNKTLTKNTSQIRPAIIGAVLLTALITAPVSQAGGSFELRLDASHLNGARELESGNIDEAIKQMIFEHKKAGLAKPNYLPSAIALCAAYIMKGNVEQATAFCDKAVEANSANALARNNRGVLNASQGNLEAAIADFEQAVEKGPHFAEARRNLERAQVRFAQQQETHEERVAATK